MNSRDLEAFVAVVETGSIVAASAKLNLTQPGVTRRVQNLELLLGGPLLDRTAKPLKPTAVGRSAYDHGRRLLQGIEDLRSEVAPSKAVRGEMRLGLATYMADAALCDTIDVVRARYPELSLHLVAAWTPRLVEQVLRGELDAATICLPDGVPPPDTLLARDLGAQGALLVAAPRLGVPPRPRLSDLARFPWVVSQDGCGYRAVIKRRFEAQHLPFTVAVESLSIALRQALIARGIGLGIVTAASLADGGWRDAIEIVEAEDFEPRIRCWLIHRHPLGRLEAPMDLFRAAIERSLHGEALDVA